MAEEHRRSQPVAHQLSSAVVPKLAKNHPPERSHCARAGLGVSARPDLQRPGRARLLKGLDTR